MTYRVVGPARFPVKGSGWNDLYDVYSFTFEQDRKYVTLAKGDLKNASGILTRIMSMCVFGYVFGSDRCDDARQRDLTMKYMMKEDKGLIILAYDEEGRGVGIENHIKAMMNNDVPFIVDNVSEMARSELEVKREKMRHLPSY